VLEAVKGEGIGEVGVVLGELGDGLIGGSG